MLWADQTLLTSEQASVHAAPVRAAARVFGPLRLNVGRALLTHKIVAKQPRWTPKSGPRPRKVECLCTAFRAQMSVKSRSTDIQSQWREDSCTFVARSDVQKGPPACRTKLRLRKHHAPFEPH